MQNVNTFFPRSAQNWGSKKCLYYTPFGVELKGRNFKKTGVGVKDYRYGYQGSEVDNEVKGDGNSYTTEFRQLDPRLGRWLSLDPIVHSFQSPYCSMDNNPIKFNDPKGLDVEYKGSRKERRQLKRQMRWMRKHDKDFDKQYEDWENDKKTHTINRDNRSHEQREKDGTNLEPNQSDHKVIGGNQHYFGLQKIAFAKVSADFKLEVDVQGSISMSGSQRINVTDGVIKYTGTNYKVSDNLRVYINNQLVIESGSRAFRISGQANIGAAIGLISYTVNERAGDTNPTEGTIFKIRLQLFDMSAVSESMYTHQRKAYKRSELNPFKYVRN